MKTLLIFALILIVPTSGWAMRGFSVGEAASDALIIADWAQTLEIADNPDNYYEGNRLLGRHPSRERVNWSCGAALVANTLLHRILPDDWLTAYQVIFIGVQGVNVYRNYSIGLKGEF